MPGCETGGIAHHEPSRSFSPSIMRDDFAATNACRSKGPRSATMADSNEVVIIAGCRTPIGKFQGSLSDMSAPQLGAVAVREAVKRANLRPQQVDECIMGNVVSAGLGQNPARQAALFGGLAPEVGAMTINKVCGSGLKAVAL